VSWDVRFLQGGRARGERIGRRLARKVVPGSILLLHDGHDRRPEGRPDVLVSLPVVLETLERLGYRCVPLP
jgi:hypothetical protein